MHPPFSYEIQRAETAVVQQLDQYDDPSSDDHLYVLEFQGVGQQYVMYGRTRSWWRRLSSHRQAAAPHGFALLNGWLSPGVSDAYPLEQIALGAAGLLHGQAHFRERFYNLPFEHGLCIGRAVFELSSRYSLKRRRPRSYDQLLALISRDEEKPKPRGAIDLSMYEEPGLTSGR